MYTTLLRTGYWQKYLFSQKFLTPAALPSHLCVQRSGHRAADVMNLLQASTSVRTHFYFILFFYTVPCTFVCAGENGCKRRGKEWCSSSMHCSTDHRGWPFLLLQLQAQSSPTLCKQVIHQFVPSGAMLGTQSSHSHHPFNQAYSATRHLIAIMPSGSILNTKSSHSNHAFRLCTQHQVTSQQSHLQALYSTLSHLIATMPTGSMLNTRMKCFPLHEILTSRSLRWNTTLKADASGELTLSVRLVLKTNYCSSSRFFGRQKVKRLVLCSSQRF